MVDLLYPLLNDIDFQENPPDIKIKQLFRYYADHTFENEIPVKIIIDILDATRQFLGAASLNYSELRTKRYTQITLFERQSVWEKLTARLKPNLETIPPAEQAIIRQIIECCHRCIAQQVEALKDKNPDDPIYHYSAKYLNTSALTPQRS